MTENNTGDIIHKKQSVKPKAMLPKYYTNEHSDASSEEVNKYILGKYPSVNIFDMSVNMFIETLIICIDNDVKTYLTPTKTVQYDLSLESVYSGMAGIALFYNYYAFKKNDKEKRKIAKNIIEKCMSKLNHNSNSLTYLTGTSGIYVTAAEIYYDMGNVDGVKKMIKKVVSLLPLVLNKKISDVLLYGRAGYLYSLLVLKNIGWKNPESDDIIRKVITAILNNGFYTSNQCSPGKTPLLFKCHRKKYLGVTLGLCGILFCLLLAISYITEEEQENLIKPTLDYLLTLRVKSGNLPLSLCNDPNTFVQWCHGASGASHTFALAYKVFRDEKYLKAAKEFAEIVWKQGLLSKGYGLCHGVTGNAYSFLSLFKVTEDIKYLHQTAKFMDWCMKIEAKNVESLDDYSLFTGFSGIAYAMLDFQDPLNADIPGLRLSLLKL